MTGKNNLNAGFLNLQANKGEAAASEKKKKAAPSGKSHPVKIPKPDENPGVFDPQYIDARMDKKYMGILNSVIWKDQRTGDPFCSDILARIPERFFIMIDEVSEECRFFIDYDSKEKKYYFVGSVPNVFCSGESPAETRSQIRKKTTNVNRIEKSCLIDENRPGIIMDDKPCSDRLDPDKRNYNCEYHVCPVLVSLYLAYLKAKGKTNVIETSRKKYRDNKDAVDLDESNPWYYMTGLADFVFKPYVRDHYVPFDKLSKARAFLDEGLYSSEFKFNKELGNYIFACYDSTYKRMGVKGFFSRNPDIIPYSDLNIESRPAESASRHQSEAARSKFDATILATERDFRQFSPCPYCDNDFCEIKYAAFVDMLIHTGEYLEYCEKSRQFEKEHRKRYKKYAGEIPELNDLLSTIEIQDSFYGCVSGSSASHTKEVADVIARELSYKPCVSPNIAHMTMLDFLSELRNREYYKKITDYLVPSWGVPAKNQIYILDGIDEYAKALAQDQYKGDLLHLIEILSSVKDNRYFILVGTDSEIDNLLNQFDELKSVFSLGRIRIKDMTANEIYEDMFWRLSKTNRHKIDEDFKARAIEYISLNQGVIPYNNMEMSRYLAAYINKHGRQLPSLNKVDVEKILDEMIGMQDIKDKLREFEAYTKFKKRRAAGGKAMPGANTHMAFLGNPGTGKTTVARIVAQIMFNIGLLRKNTVVEVQRKDLIGQYVGQTAIKTQGVIDKAMGGVLFIDEAYSITATESKQDYGGECVATLIKAMEDHKDDLVVIFAGYVDEMSQFMESNPGLKSRIGYTFDFKDYEPEELARMFVVKMEKNGFELEDGVEEKVKEIARYFKESDDFGNGRFIDSLVQDTLVRHSQSLDESKMDIISADDVPEIEDILKTTLKGWEKVNPKDITDEELRRIAVHELGHAIAGYYLSGNMEIEKISIQADASGTLGFVKHSRKNKALSNEVDYLNNLAMTLSGKNAEKIVFESHSEGCHSDIAKAKAMAKRMVENYAMGSWLEEKADIELLRKADKMSVEILEKNIDKLTGLADELMQKKSIEKDEITAFLEG